MASIPNLMLHQDTERSSVDPGKVTKQWLNALEDLLKQEQFDRLQDLFLEDSWWRDILALSWKVSSKHGLTHISQHLRDGLVDRKLLKLESIETGVLIPRIVDMGPFTLVESAFTFETTLGHGRGYLRLGNVGPSEWKAWIVMTQLEQIKGHEESHLSRGTSTATKELDTESREAYENPRVVIIGAGHMGLSTAARLKQIGVPTLIIDKCSRVGDSWRQRYSNLRLHDPIWEDHLPYMKFPETWPAWPNKDQVANWLEHYQTILDIPVRLNSEITSAKFDHTSKLWKVELLSTTDGSKTFLQPAHVVLATGFHSDIPNMPTIADQDHFKGQILHSTQHKSASEISHVKNKKVVVVGSSATAHDICQDFATQGADTTMIQRGANYVYSTDSKINFVDRVYSTPNITLEDADLAASSIPFPVAMTLMIGGTQAFIQNDKEMLDNLAKTEFKFLKGENGKGLIHYLFEKFGGHYIEQGATQMIIDGKIKVRQCDEGVSKFLPGGLVLADGREIPADIVVMATGYKFADHITRKIFEPAVADRMKIGGFNEDNELYGLARTLGHPALWFNGGSFAFCRPFSRMIALQIKAVELGLNTTHYKATLN